ncbi:MAG: PEP-CTERM sorting domain-containing protein [Verrucomicrobiota bacterium]|nr:PEP-CTERM sorting domain-containing protein [Verrucomicrobiota bacterium]
MSACAAVGHAKPAHFPPGQIWPPAGSQRPASPPGLSGLRTLPGASRHFAPSPLQQGGSGPVYYTNIFNFNVNQVIPDDNPAGLTLAQNITVAGSGTIASVSVNLDISGGFNGDLYAYLRGPNGGFAVLLNRVGVGGNNYYGYSDSGFNVTFADNAANGDIHYYQNIVNPNGGVLTGVWAPDGETNSPTGPPSSFTGSGPATLSTFDGTDANGTWTLFLADLAAGNQSTIVSWGLDIVTIPEPPTISLASIGGVGLLFLFLRRRR